MFQLKYFSYYCIFVGFGVIFFNYIMLKNLTKISKDTDFRKSTILFYSSIGWTSFDLVKKVRNIIKSNKKIKKIKVGHAGTLDPLQMIIDNLYRKIYKKDRGDSKTKKNIYRRNNSRKNYPSFDRETEVNETFETSHINKDLLMKLVKLLKGNIVQKPPIFSALKRGGKRLYLHAREGTNIEIKLREVHIEKFEITNINIPKIEFRVICSKGTYIRSLYNDFGEKLKSGAFLSKLRRTQIGNFKLEDFIQ